MVDVFSRQAAERFNDLLEAGRPSAHNDLSPLLNVARQLNRMGSSVHADPDFAARCRTRLMAVAAVQEANKEEATLVRTDWRGRYQGVRRREEPPRRVPRRLALLTGSLAVLLGLSSVGMAASSGAKPGDTLLYTLKRNKESAQLALARTDVSRGELHLQFARNRLNEAESIESLTKIVSTLDDADADMRSAMYDLGSAAMEHGSAAPLDTIDRFADAQRQDLNHWLGDLSGSKRTRAADSLTVLDQVQQRSKALRATLNCQNGPAGASKWDEYGPFPRPCAAVPTGEFGKPKSPEKTGEPSASPSVAPASSTPSASSAPPSSAPAAQSPNLLSPVPTGTPPPQSGQVPNMLGGIFKAK